MTNYIITYCCGKQCERNSFEQISNKRLNDRLNLLCHVPLSSIIDDKIQLPTSFSTPCRKCLRPLTSSFNPTPTTNLDPTSILTIRSLHVMHTSIMHDHSHIIVIRNLRLRAACIHG